MLPRVALLLLVVFHAWLFWHHASTGRLFDPAVALRWLAAGGVSVAFAALRHLGLPLLWGRRAVVLWLVVVLLHAHAAWSPGRDSLAGPETAGAVAVLVLQATTAAGLGLALGLALLLLLAKVRARAAVPVARLVRPASRIAAPVACRLVLAPRPPPLG